MAQLEVKDDIGNLGAPTTPAPNDRQEIKRRWVVPGVIMVVAAGVLFFGIRSRTRAEDDLRTVTRQAAVPSVSVVLPRRTADAQEVILPGHIQSFI